MVLFRQKILQFFTAQQMSRHKSGAEAQLKGESGGMDTLQRGGRWMSRDLEWGSDLDRIERCAGGAEKKGAPNFPQG